MVNDECYQYRSLSRVGVTSIQSPHLPPSPVNHKWGGDRGILNLPPPVPCIPDTRPPFSLGFFPVTHFRLRNSKHCCVIPSFLPPILPRP